MNKFISSDNNIKKLTSMNDTALRFISKEGCSQFPTIIFLANRMYLSDENNIIEDLHISDKIKVGDDFYWYKSSNFRANLRDTIQDVVRGVSFFKKDTSPKIKNVVRIYNVSNTEAYFAISDNTILFGSYDSTKPISMPNGFTLDNLVSIFRNGSIDYAVFNSGIYSIDTASGTMVNRYSTKKHINDASCNSSYMVIATNDGGEVLVKNQDGSYSRSYSVGYETWTESVSPGGTSSGSTSSEPTVTYHDNGFPISEIATMCCIDGSNLYIGDSTTMAKFALGSSYDRGVEAGAFFRKHYHSCGKEFYITIATFVIVNKTGGSSLQLTLDSSSITSVPIDVFVDGSTTMLLYGSSISTYDSAGVYICTLNSSNGILNAKSIMVEGMDIIRFVDTSGNFFTTSPDLGVRFITTPFVFDINKSDKKLTCANKMLSIRQLMRCVSEQSVYDATLGNVNGKPTTFMSIFTKRSNNRLFTYFGNDRRQEPAYALKEICEVFDIK